MLRFMVGWSAWDLTQSATWVGVVAALMLAPAFVLSPLFGLFSDRINPRYGLLVSMFVHALIALVGAFAVFTAFYNIHVLLALALAMGVVTSGHSPMRLALVPLLVHREALPSAVGLSAMTFNIARILGPALGAWLLQTFGAGWTFAAAVMMFVASGAVLLSLRGVGQRAPKPREPLAQQFIAGLRYLQHNKGIQLIFALTLVNGLMGRTFIELLPAVSGALLGGGADQLAILTASAGAGSIVGGLVVSRQSADLGRLLQMAAVGIGVACLMTLGIRWVHGLVPLSGFVILLSLFTTMAGTGCQTLTQLSLANEFQGRVISLWTLLAMGSPAIGSAFYGALSDVLGFVPVFAVAASAALFAVVIIYARRRWLLA